jgi:hypothetical protein
MGLDGFPNQKNGSERNRERISLERIERARAEVSHITDGLNLSIDEGIREAVAVLRALNVETTQSCEGHLDQGSPSPYVDIQDPGKPDHRFLGEIEQLQTLAKKYNITSQEIGAWPSDKDRMSRAKFAYDEWMTWRGEASREETGEYKAWRQRDVLLLASFDELIAQFYASRVKPAEGYIFLEHDRLRTAYTLYDKYFAAAASHAADPLSQADRQHLRTSLPMARAEMGAFIGFLKLKFFEGDVR